jgi:quercetin dioxygenase-like cupin family protein
MHFYDIQSLQPHELVAGIHARTAWGEHMLCSVVDLQPGSVLPVHSHPHEQVGVVLEGELEMTIAGETRLLQPGTLYIIPGDVEHSARVGERAARVLDVFSPVREEYKFE